MAETDEVEKVVEEQAAAARVEEAAEPAGIPEAVEAAATAPACWAGRAGRGAQAVAVATAARQEACVVAAEAAAAKERVAEVAAAAAARVKEAEEARGWADIRKLRSRAKLAQFHQMKIGARLWRRLPSILLPNRHQTMRHPQ